MSTSPQDSPGEAQTRSLLFRDYADWYCLRSLLLRLAESKDYISAGDQVVFAADYAARMDDVDCTFTLAQVKEMGWLPRGDATAMREALVAAETVIDADVYPETARLIASALDRGSA